MLTLIPLTGVPEVQDGDDLVALLLAAARGCGVALEDGDVLVVSSKVVSKSLGLWAQSSDRAAAVASQSVRVVAERMAGDRVTQIVQSVAGPVMAAGGVDASNTGERDGVLLLPADPDAEAGRLREGVLAATGLREVGVLLTDTAGRPWRFGQTDFALGAAGVEVVDDLRGGVDADGRPLAVTARAIGDELAAAADLVKGKADAIPAALVRGSGYASADGGSGGAAGGGPGAGPGAGVGARQLIRVGREDWFDYGRAESVRAALGVEPGSAHARETGVASVGFEDTGTRLARAIAVALHDAPTAGVDAGGEVVRVSAPSGYELGVAVARLQVALWGEGLTASIPPEADSLEVTLQVRER